MKFSIPNTYQITNPFLPYYHKKIDVVLLAHNLIGTVRGKSANGLIMNGSIFNVVAIIDVKTTGQKTSEICQGIKQDIPIYTNFSEAHLNHKTNALILLISPTIDVISEIQKAIISGLDIINTSFSFLNNIPELINLSEKYGVKLFDLRNVIHQQAYPDTNIIKRNIKVVYITGTDCGLGKRTAAYELVKEARENGINAAMYATGQTGLMLGEKGTVVDALVSEFSNGVVSQQVCQFDQLGYDLLFVEGQSDIFHPANSAVAISILHGANPDCIVIVHDEDRKVHKGFDDESRLYLMHPLEHYIKTIEMLSLPCGPAYKTVGIATIGDNNINKIKNLTCVAGIEVADVRLTGGPKLLLDSILKYLNMQISKEL